MGVKTETERRADFLVCPFFAHPQGDDEFTKGAQAVANRLTRCKQPNICPSLFIFTRGRKRKSAV
jgi:hypothetical protein